MFQLPCLISAVTINCNEIPYREIVLVIGEHFLEFSCVLELMDVIMDARLG